MLSVYKRFKKIDVLLLGIMHPAVKKYSRNIKRLLEIVDFNNKTKSEVDVVEQMTLKYSVLSASRR